MPYLQYTKQEYVTVSPKRNDSSPKKPKRNPLWYTYVYSKQLPLHLAPILCADEFDGGRAVALSPRGVEGTRRVHGVRTDGDLIGAWDQPRGRKSGETHGIQGPKW
jgi:hypothetical protein